MKAYTNIAQSKKLAEILPVESADLWWDTNEFEPRLHKHYHQYLGITINPTPCWSLAALLQMMPHCIYDRYDLVLGKFSDNKGWYVTYDDIDHFTRFYVTHSNLIDACVEMIVTLKENDLI